MRPFLKWAGNKYRIMQHLHTVLPAGARLIEPFVGSAAVFLNTDYPHYLLTDSNPDLISLFQHIKREGLLFINYCRTFFTSENNTATRFYSLRDEFNTTTNPRLKSALFVYLNRHGFNGLCRYNSSGYFNVPFGTYHKPYFPEKEMLFFHKKSRDVLFRQADFLNTLKKARPGDVVYCDPPYIPLSDTANFTHYDGKHFGFAQQTQLAQYAQRLAEKGIVTVISNHDTPLTQTLYQSAQIVTLEVTRTISCCITERQKTKELLAIFR